MHPHSGVPEDSWYIGFLFRDIDYSGNDYFGNGHSMWGDNWEAGVCMWPEPLGDEGLDFYRWYRFETHIHWLAEKTASTPALYYLRVYDDNNNLVVDENNLFSDNYDGAWQPDVLSLVELYSLNNSSEGRRFYINANHQCLMFGTNGFGSADEPRLYLIDKLAISAEGWVGE
jgi:hypothetical protein